eukprot:6183979-Pleurochrysis_carterae.AAC.1
MGAYSLGTPSAYILSMEESTYIHTIVFANSLCIQSLLISMEGTLISNILIHDVHMYERRNYTCANGYDSLIVSIHALIECKRRSVVAADLAMEFALYYYYAYPTKVASVAKCMGIVHDQCDYADPQS